MTDMMNRWLCVKGAVGSVPQAQVPELPYAQFAADMKALLLTADGVPVADSRCVAYFAMPNPVAGEGGLVFYALVARDVQGDVLVASHVLGYYHEGFLDALSKDIPALHVYEREITERYGVQFKGMPWDKPLRYPFDRHHRDDSIDTYPFYEAKSRDLHQVHVGPVHAGIIEPGSFRFLCDGERIVHLEIALGYQHRGVESLIAGAGDHRLRQICLGESIAGDTVVGHGVAMANLMESGVPAWEGREVVLCERAVALEMERMAVHIGDTAALCMDIAYQTGHVACEALRTLVINAMQQWCGNRFGKGLVRPFGANYRLTLERVKHIEATLAEVIERYRAVGRDLLSTPSVLARLEGICTVSRSQALRVGAVGPAARMAGIGRDVRKSHNFYPIIPDGAGEGTGFEPVTELSGDLLARLKMRLREAEASYGLIAAGCKELVGKWFESYPAPDYGRRLAVSSLAFSLVEAWRGEVCHIALTDADGRIAAYRIVDPSVHNWMMLALSVRGAQISDFPVSNKSFNLSYCGHDL